MWTHPLCAQESCDTDHSLKVDPAPQGGHQLCCYRPWAMETSCWSLVCFRCHRDSKINHEWAVYLAVGALRAWCVMWHCHTCVIPRGLNCGDTEGALKCHNEHWALCFIKSPKTLTTPIVPPMPPSRVLGSITQTQRWRLHNLLTGSQTDLNWETWPRTSDPFEVGAVHFCELLRLRKQTFGVGLSPNK